jgi:hypothetical protein
MHRRILYGLTYLAASLSLAHHTDHVIRYNAVGWPLTGEVNAFTMSLIIYPINHHRSAAVPSRPSRARFLGGVLAATVPAVVFSTEVTKAF